MSATVSGPVPLTTSSQPSVQKRGKRNFKTSTGRIKTGRDRIISKYETGSRDSKTSL